MEEDPSKKVTMAGFGNFGNFGKLWTVVYSDSRNSVIGATSGKEWNRSYQRSIQKWFNSLYNWPHMRVGPLNRTVSLNVESVAE